MPLDPFMVTRRQLNEKFASHRLVTRMIAAGWITVVRPGKPGRETLYDFASAKLAWNRIRAGEEPGGSGASEQKGD